MNCFNHPELASVGVCQDCQKGLCNKCASLYSLPICTQCNNKRKRDEKSRIYTELLLTFGIGIAFAYFFIKIGSNDGTLFKNNNERILMWSISIYSGASIIAGWKTLSTFTSRYFLFLPVIGWLIYLVLKLWISGMIGPIMLPIRSFKNFRRLNQLKKIQKN